MKKIIERGDKVCWPNGEGTAKGLVIDTYMNPLKNATADMKAAEEKNRALLIELNDGSKVLKLETEVNKEGF